MVTKVIGELKSVSGLKILPENGPRGYARSRSKGGRGGGTHNCFRGYKSKVHSIAGAGIKKTASQSIYSYIFESIVRPK